MALWTGMDRVERNSIHRGCDGWNESEVPPPVFAVWRIRGEWIEVTFAPLPHLLAKILLPHPKSLEKAP